MAVTSTSSKLARLGSLQQITSVKLDDRNDPLPRVSCVTLCHNESMIIDQFLDHYRALGVCEFFIVDDRSTDGTFEKLLEQPDVSLFRPLGEAEFKDNVGIWRQEILDRFCANSWVSLPDMDEFLYLRKMTATLPTVAYSMDAVDEGALMAVMIDMYADQPFSEQQYTGASPLVEAYPFFDGQGRQPNGPRISALPQSFTKRFPTPPVCFKGGVRERLFFTPKALSPFQRFVIARYSSMDRPLNPNWLQAWQNKFTRAVTKSAFEGAPFVLNKFALLKWRSGMKFPRAPHSVSAKMRVSESITAMLHYKFYKGISGLEYNAKRGQHVGGAKIYTTMIDQQDVLRQSPMCEDTRRFSGIASLAGILR